MTEYKYAIKITAKYDGKIIEGLLAGANEHGVLKTDWMTQEGEASYYAVLETAQSVAYSINKSHSSWRAVVVDRDGNPINS